MATSTCDSASLKLLINEIKEKINGDDLNTKMIEHLKTLDYHDDLDLDFISLVIGRIINEKSLNFTDLPTLSALTSCVTKTNIVNCDILLLKLLQSAKTIIAAASSAAASATASNNELKEFIEECEKIYPKLSYHLKMRIQYVLYKNIYKTPTSPLNTEKLRKEFVNFFNNRCLNAQYRNILYTSMYTDYKKIMDELNKPNNLIFADIQEELKRSILNLEINNTNPPKFNINGTDTQISDDQNLLQHKEELKAIFENKMRILGGNKGVHMYHLCSSSVNISLKKVQAKTAREGAKIMANKLLNKSGNKSVKFLLKRMIGNKEKYYNYQAFIDKSGKISIKST